MAAPRERLILQSDWDKSLSQDGGKAWVTSKLSDGQSLYGEISTVSLSASGVPYVTCSENFSAGNLAKKQICLSYSSPAGCLQNQLFLAPQLSICDVHSINKTVNCVNVTEGGLGVSCSSDETLCIWQSDTGQVRRQLNGHVAEVTVCKFFPSGLVVLSGSVDMQLKIWSAETGDCAATLIGHTAGISDVSIVERGRNVVSASRDGTIKLWDVGQAQCIYTFTDISSGIINSCALASTSVDLNVPGESASEREVLTEGKMLLVACENGSVQAYGLHSRHKIFEVGGHGAVNCCTFVSPDIAAFGTQDGYITVVDTRNTQIPLAEWKEARSAILSLQPYRSGCFVSTGDGSCFFVNESFNTELELTGSDCDPVYGASIANRCLYTCCRDGIIRSYNIAVL